MNPLEFYRELEKNFSSSELYKDIKIFRNINEFSNFQIKDKVAEMVNRYNNLDYPSVACGIITYNEEKNISRCIRSLNDLFDEIVILDSYSTDKTVEYAQVFNVDIYFKKWEDDFSKQRNSLKKFVKSRWIYYIDADNWITSNLNNEFKRAAKLMDFLKQNVIISPLIREHNNHIYSDNRKMFLTHGDINFHGKVHEEPLHENMSIPKNMILNIIVNHDGYNESVSDQSYKNKRNIKLTKEMIEIESNHPKWYYFLAREMYQQGESFELIEKNLKRAISLYNFSDYKRYYSETLLLAIKLYINQNQFRKSLEYIDIFNKEFPKSVDSEYYYAILTYAHTKIKLEKLIISLDNELNSDKISYINSNFEHLKLIKINILEMLNQWEHIYNMCLELDKITRMSLFEAFELKKNAIMNVLEELNEKH